MLSPEETFAFEQSVLNVRTAGRRYLESHREPVATIRFVANLQQGVDRVMREATARAPVACKAGCHYCCHARVEVLAPEAFLVAAEIAGRDDEPREAILDRLERHRAGVDETATSWSGRRACPFLVDALCSIYEVRPTACRKAHSLDVAACAAASPMIPQDLGTALHSEALAIGTANAYRDRDLDATKHEFIAAVLVAAKDPFAQAKWLAGERVFD